MKIWAIFLKAGGIPISTASFIKMGHNKYLYDVVASQIEDKVGFLVPPTTGRKTLGMTGCACVFEMCACVCVRDVSPVEGPITLINKQMFVTASERAGRLLEITTLQHLLERTEIGLIDRQIDR